MKKILSILFSLNLLGMVSMAAETKARVGAPAPDFTLTSHTGASVTLSAFKGKHVVLEWVSFGCPFVVKHYSTGNMQQLQETWGAKEVVWLTINSAGEGRGAFESPEKAATVAESKKLKAHALLLDPSGEVGRMYEAKVTPHLYVIDPAGVLIYAGAIDDKATTNKDDVKTAKNYVVQALEASLAGRPVETPQTKPYGCGIKYTK